MSRYVAAYTPNSRHLSGPSRQGSREWRRRSRSAARGRRTCDSSQTSRDVPGPERYPSQSTGTAERLRIGLSPPLPTRHPEIRRWGDGLARGTGRGVAPAETSRGPRGLRIDIVQDLGRLLPASGHHYLGAGGAVSVDGFQREGLARM